jgi:competence protein ComEA
MTPWNSKNGNAVPSSSPSPTSPSLLARVRASAWTGVAARVAGIAVALLVLGWIGRTAAAGPTSPMSLAATERDASAALLPTLVPLDASAPLVTSTDPSAPPPPATATASPAPAPPGAAHGRATATEPVYLNHASVDELRRLPGVGPKRAEAILVLRQRLGRFQRVEDLLRVKGVGRGAVKKWRPLVRLDAPDAGGA